MRKFQVTVNGNTYEVEVEELQGGQGATPVAAPVTAAPAPAAPAAPKAAPQKAAAPAGVPAGATKVTSPMPGTILDIKVNVGDSVKEGDPIAILEAMKMENEIVATASGKIASINTSKGASVNTGDLIATIG